MSKLQSIMPKHSLDDLRAIVGVGGLIGEAALAPMLEEWRGQWQGTTQLALAPATVEEVSAIIRYCYEHRIAVTPQGGNTGLVGGQIPFNGEVLLSLRRMRTIRKVSPESNTLILDAGVTLADAQQAADAVDRLFPLSIGSEGTCQIGGAISTNAGGVNVIRYGNMRDLILGIEAVLPNGDVWNGLKELRKDNTGYDLKQLFIGGEGTLGVVTGAVLKMVPKPREKMSIVVGFDSPENAVALLSRAQAESGGQVTSFELFSRQSLSLVLKNIPGTRDPLSAACPWYGLIEFSSGREGELRAMVEVMLADAFDAGDIIDATIADSLAQAEDFWRIRHSMSEAMKPEGKQAKHDVSIPVSAIPAFLESADAVVEEVCPGARIIAFGHMGDGNIHYDVMKPCGMEEERFTEFYDPIEQAVYDVIVRFEGSISAEHGIGIARCVDLAERKSDIEIAMMHAIKSALDPHGIMNPGKMLLQQ